ncbi:hypothetical protein VNO77_04243 [Canavalia gladiata]|uniref:Uncharacterized protein n=1 Tax=Canavalia gladiata TaxID=3824 RepID=A0AAN9MW62_CANGL
MVVKRLFLITPAIATTDSIANNLTSLWPDISSLGITAHSSHYPSLSNIPKDQNGNSKFVSQPSASASASQVSNLNSHL